MITTRKILKCVAAIIFFCFMLTSVGFAQQSPKTDNVDNEIQQHLKNDYLSFGILLQGLADFQPERVSGYNGFSASKGRFKVSGIFNNRFGYKLQATMLNSQSLIDANVYYQPNSNLQIKIGQFKSPFSYEYETGAGSTPFVNRSAVVNQLDPKRQLGVQLESITSNGGLRFKGGIFNGDGTLQNSDNDFQYIGRLEANLLNNDQENSATIGGYASYEENDWLWQQGGVAAERTLMGSFVNIVQGDLSLNGEFIYSWIDPEVGQEHNPYGYYATVGYTVTTKSRILLRWDSFDGDNLTNDTNSVVAGFNYSPSKFTRIELNYVLPTTQSAEYSNFLAVLQVGF